MGKKYDIDDKAKVSFSHKISNIVNSDMYKSGKGTGSSFLAESYSSGGIIMVIITSYSLGYLTEFTVRNFYAKNILFNFCALIFWSHLLFMPRGSLLSFTLVLFRNLFFIIVCVPIYRCGINMCKNLKKDKK